MNTHCRPTTETDALAQRDDESLENGEMLEITKKVLDLQN